MNDELYLDSLKRISDRLDAIDLKLENQDTKLNNHIAHIVGDISAIKTDIGWLKVSGTKSNASEDKTEETQATSTADIGWLMWAVRLMIGGIVLNFIGLIVLVYKLVIK